jgi:hypothetical protein
MKESANFLSLENSKDALRCKSTSRIKKKVKNHFATPHRETNIDYNI